MSTRPRPVIEGAISAAEAALREAKERNLVINERWDALEDRIRELQPTATDVGRQAALERLADVPVQMRAIRAESDRYIDELIGLQQRLAELQAELAVAGSAAATTLD